MKQVPSGARRWWALAAVNLSVLAVTVDGTALSVAQSTLTRALHATESDLEWFTSGYLLLMAAAVLPAGLIALTYGLIQAGQDGWGNPAALALMAADSAVLTGFVLDRWPPRHRHLGQHPVRPLPGSPRPARSSRRLGRRGPAERL
jgi:hypothetical protein